MTNATKYRQSLRHFLTKMPPALITRAAIIRSIYLVIKTLKIKRAVFVSPRHSERGGTSRVESPTWNRYPIRVILSVAIAKSKDPGVAAFIIILRLRLDSRGYARNDV